MDRRSFIKLTAVIGTSAALASCGNPENQFIRFVPAEDIVPGQATWKPGVCPLCAAGCGLTVRVMDADAEVVRDGQAGVVTILAAKKLEGAPDHPVNGGGLCARGQAAIQLTYHPDRITQPLKRSGDRGSGQYEAIGWDEALSELVSTLNALRGAGMPQALAAITRPGRSQRAVLLDRVLEGFGAPPAVRHELFGDDVLRRANAISFGRHQLPSYDLANAHHVISFGADFLGTWNSPVAQSRAYGEMRRGRDTVRGRLMQVEARMSQSGANADEWVPARPGTEGVLALGLAHVIVAGKLRPTDGFTRDVSSYTPDAVAKATGVDARRIERLARELAGSPRAVAIAGGPALAQTNGLFTALAINSLNQLFGSVEQPGGVFFTPQAGIGRSEGRQGRPLQELLASNPQALLVDGANPVFTSPAAWKVRETLLTVPFIVSFGMFFDETSVLADLVLPDHSFLEGWTDAVPESGARVAVASVAPPAMRPLYETRATGDVLLEVARRLEQPVALPWQTFEEMVGAQLGESIAAAQEKGWVELPAAVGAAPVGADFTSAQAGAAAVGADFTSAQAGAAAVGADFTSAQDPTFDGDPQQYPFHFLPYESVQFGDGATAHLPWLQEMPDPLTSAMWSSWVEINPRTAERLGVATGDLVEITSTQGSVRAPAYLSPAIAPDLVAMPVGQGHDFFTRYATGRGGNPVALLAPLTDSATGALAWAATRVRLARAGDPDGRLVLFAGGMREHGEEGR